MLKQVTEWLLANFAWSSVDDAQATYLALWRNSAAAMNDEDRAIVSSVIDEQRLSQLICDVPLV
ncbi:hypothetical protein [Terrarubrum flagellatum]|uniref:hypothetical protein n=1 Tax=Terrirubrum flagellatum TaxID=2895980 RepID=UPI00314541EF